MSAPDPISRYLIEWASERRSVTDVVGRVTDTVVASKAAAPAMLAGLVESAERFPAVIVTPTEDQARRLSEDLEVYLPKTQVHHLPGWETLPFERVSPSIKTMGERSEVIWRLTKTTEPVVVVTSVKAMAQKLGPSSTDCTPIFIKPAMTVDLDQLSTRLVEYGYRREPQVANRGEFSIRGSVVDVFGANLDGPIRVDLWGDKVERLNQLDVATQRSGSPLDNAKVFPARELRQSDLIAKVATELLESDPWGADHWQKFADGETFEAMESWLPWFSEPDQLLVDHLNSDSLLVIVDPKRVLDRAHDIVADEADLAATLAETWVSDGSIVELKRLHCDYDRAVGGTDARVVSVPHVAMSPNDSQFQVERWATPGEHLQRQVLSVLESGGTVIVTGSSNAHHRRVSEVMGRWGVSVGAVGVLNVGGVSIWPFDIHDGLLVEGELGILSESDWTGRRRRRRRRRGLGAGVGGYEGLTDGDYVVHEHHGVAQYQGMVTSEIGGFERDYLLLAYRGEDKLYLPADQLDQIRRYQATDTPRLNKLGGSEFARTKAKIKSAVNKIAQELVVLYQKRVSTVGHSFSADSAWQTEMEQSFEFELTPDQKRSLAEIKADMEQPLPMDRLLVGDVGFGKTEVALRAAFKAVADSKQVVVLVPTTLLAQQHYETFCERLGAYPVEIKMLSRFVSDADARAVLADLANGNCDIVIGTHRLLNKQVKFKDLGMLIIDEEQRFGVNHKERIKGLSAGVDVLSLSATPIPRTLELSLTGLRDLSVINTPPSDRKPILTYVGEYDDRAVSEAIRRELLRDGQVFFVHNRVKTIEGVAEELRQLVPEARVAVAHGQMDEVALEDVVVDFTEGRYDVLVCTTIIESGIDMPRVNTLVVDNSERLGLGQLHQIRGRVGRSEQRAYAYLFTKPDASLTEQAYERLRTVGESTNLGSGFKIAMRDLEIRGAGNLLGTGQSGHVEAVGYDLYCQMINEAVNELKGEDAPTKTPEVHIELGVGGHLPDTYVQDSALRVEAYKRLADCAQDAEVDEIVEEWVDRFGSLPPEAMTLVEVARLRCLVLSMGVTEIKAAKKSVFGAETVEVALGPVTLRASQEIRFARLLTGFECTHDHYGPQKARVSFESKDARTLLELISKLLTELSSEQKLLG